MNTQHKKILIGIIIAVVALSTGFYFLTFNTENEIHGSAVDVKTPITDIANFDVNQAN